MILADKILSLRKKNGWSQDELAERLNVSRQSVSKWEGALSIPDINKIIEMASLFEVSTDFLLKDEIETPDFVEGKTENKRKITVDEANELMTKSKKMGYKTAIGTALCILSPVILLILLGLNQNNEMVTTGLAVGVGVTAILVLVAFAVAIFISTSDYYDKLEKIRKTDFLLDYGVEGIVKERKLAIIPRYTINLIIGTCLCILCVAPIIIASLIGASDMIIMFVVALMLGLISLAVAILITVSSEKSVYDLLLRDEDYSLESVKNEKRVGKVAGVYWPIVVAIFLVWGLVFDGWSISWIIFPIAGILFGAISALVKKDD